MYKKILVTLDGSELAEVVASKRSCGAGFFLEAGEAGHAFSGS